MTRVGLELELLAPPGSTRDDLAVALAKRWRGQVQFGLKYHGAGRLPDDAPDCRLTPATRVMRGSTWLASFVDDPTIRDDLGEGEPLRRIARTNDLRLAAWVERRCWHRLPSRRFDALVKTFETIESEEGLLDPWGHPLLLWHVESMERARVCEVVLAPLATKERTRVLRDVLAVATKLGFTVPAESATHLHFDAAPFRSTRALKALVLRWSAERAGWLEHLRPNPRCRKLGPFAPAVIRVAELTDDDERLEVLCAGLLLAGLSREVDLNLLGAVERFPKQPTIEVRCVPGTLSLDEVQGHLETAETFLRSCLHR